MTPLEYVEEITHLRAAGLTDALIVGRLRVTPGAVEKALQRAGRPDLARPFGKVRRTVEKRPRARRRYPCPTCPGTRANGATVCRACYLATERAEPGYAPMRAAS